MRDAFGSTFMFKLIIIFIVAFVSFMTIAASYARVFRVKNGVIDILEQMQYDSSSDSEDDINNYLSNFSYNYPASQYPSAKSNCDSKSGFYSENGACIIRNEVSSNEVYYKVILYLVIDFPFFNYNPVIPISGETEVIVLPY
ncbi:MAG: hypothetical protein IJ509_03010 [Bacilli bacterium]|nr:hypothetical protein [Bacilli bacterium]